ncbi:Uncharacterized protein dnm_038380 [Desulfonema magnum]|uniref:Uncharacterized protein n=1 Tax=Desulfonema magnum TaxID=45655 RepID=A0A975BLS8_9BACT|nr:Uncharacterized protein dnm_038380 [Desulfonema magnum]
MQPCPAEVFFLSENKSRITDKSQITNKPQITNKSQITVTEIQILKFI